MKHDGAGNNDCNYPAPGTSQLMGGQIQGHLGPMKWSRCSQDYITRFLEYVHYLLFKSTFSLRPTSYHNNLFFQLWHLHAVIREHME